MPNVLRKRRLSSNILGSVKEKITGLCNISLNEKAKTIVVFTSLHSFKTQTFFLDEKCQWREKNRNNSHN